MVAAAAVAAAVPDAPKTFDSAPETTEVVDVAAAFAAEVETQSPEARVRKITLGLEANDGAGL